MILRESLFEGRKHGSKQKNTELWTLLGNLFCGTAEMFDGRYPEYTPIFSDSIYSLRFEFDGDLTKTDFAKFVVNKVNDVLGQIGKEEKLDPRVEKKYNRNGDVETTTVYVDVPGSIAEKEIPSADIVTAVDAYQFADGEHDAIYNALPQEMKSGWAVKWGEPTKNEDVQNESVDSPVRTRSSFDEFGIDEDLDDDDMDEALFDLSGELEKQWDLQDKALDHLSHAMPAIASLAAAGI